VRDRYLKAEGGKGGKRRGRGESLATHVQSMRAWWGGSATPGVVRGSGFAPGKYQQQHGKTGNASTPHSTWGLVETPRWEGGRKGFCIRHAYAFVRHASIAGYSQTGRSNT